MSATDRRIGGTQGELENYAAASLPRATDSYGQVALAGELDKLTRAQPGERNPTFNTVTFKLGQLVEAGHLNRDTVHERLRETVHPWIGQPGHDGKPFTWSEFEATFNSAMNGSRAKPRANVPDPSSTGASGGGRRLFFDPYGQFGTDNAASAPEAPNYDHLYLGIRQLDKIPKPEPLIEGALDTRTLFAITGRDRSFKSLLAFDWLACLASGKRWLGREVRRTRVLYVVGEGAYGLAQRRDAWETAWRTELADDWLSIRVEPVSLFSKDGVIKPALTDLIERVRAARYGVVVFDTLQRMTPGADSNLAKDAGLIVEALDRVRRVTDDGVAVGIVAHTGKGDLDIRGSSVFEDDLDIVWKLTRGDGMTVKAELIKRKDAPDGIGVELVAKPIEGTKSVILERAGSYHPVATPKYALSVLKFLALPTLPERGAARSEIAEAVECPKSGLHRALTWLMEPTNESSPYATKGGWNGHDYFKITSFGRSKLHEIEETPG